ncbi:unnamed protein product [Scytosiphon promiscuus]
MEVDSSSPLRRLPRPTDATGTPELVEIEDSPHGKFASGDSAGGKTSSARGSPDFQPSSTGSTSACSEDDDVGDGDDDDMCDSTSVDILLDERSPSSAAAAAAAPARSIATAGALGNRASQTNNAAPAEDEMSRPRNTPQRDRGRRSLDSLNCSSSSSDDDFSIRSGSRKESGKGKRRARVGHSSRSGLPAPSPTVFLSDRSRLVPPPPSRRPSEREGEDEVVVASTGGGGGGGGERATGAASTTASFVGSRSAPSPPQQHEDAAHQRLQFGIGPGRREPRRECDVSPDGRRYSSPLSPRFPPIALPVCARARLSLPPPPRPRLTGPGPSAAGIVRRNSWKAEPSRSSAAGLRRRDAMPQPSSQATSASRPAGSTSSAARSAAASPSPSSSPVHSSVSSSLSLSSSPWPSSSADVLDLSLMSPSTREVIDVLDDGALCTSPPRHRPRGTGASANREGSSSAGGGGGGSPVVEGGVASAAPRRRRPREEGVEGGRPGAPVRPSGRLLYAATKRTRMDPAYRPSRTGSGWTSGARVAAPAAAAVIDLEDDGAGDSGSVEVLRGHRRRRLTAPAAAAAGRGGAAAASERTAMRLQREEKKRQERRDAEMARQLQSEEQRGSATSAPWGVTGSPDGFGGSVGGGRHAGSSVGGWHGTVSSPGGGGGGSSSSGSSGGGLPPGAAAAVAALRAAVGSSAAGASASGSNAGGRGGGSSSRAGGRGAMSAAARRRRQRSSSNSRGAAPSSAMAAAAATYQAIAELLGNGGWAGVVGGGRRGGRGGGARYPTGSLAALQGRDLTSEDYQQLLALDDASGGGAKSKGLSKSEVAMLPQQTGNGSGPVDQCCICMEDMTSRQNITRLPACLHTFHTKCISKWLKEKSCCPIDKTPVSVSDAG